MNCNVIRDDIMFRVSRRFNLELHGCTEWWWTLYHKTSTESLRLGRAWHDTRLKSVISSIGTMRVKRDVYQMRLEEFHNGRWKLLRDFGYATFVEVYPKFQLYHGQSIKFYLEER